MAADNSGAWGVFAPGSWRHLCPLSFPSDIAPAGICGDVKQRALLIVREPVQQCGWSGKDEFSGCSCWKTGFVISLTKVY